MERVFVSERSAFFGGDWPQGFVPLPSGEGESLLRRARIAGRFEPREEAEANPAWKQWIPYCVIRCVESGPVSPVPVGVFRVRRSRGQSEARLHGRWSIGLGGHIEPTDAEENGSGPGLFRRALWRELHEELRLDLPERHALRLLGLLNDDATEVGAVHAGLVYALDLEGPWQEMRDSVSVREISKMSGELGSLAELANLWQDPSRFETWSQFLIRAGVLGRIAAFGATSPGNAGSRSGRPDPGAAGNAEGEPS